MVTPAWKNHQSLNIGAAASHLHNRSSEGLHLAGRSSLFQKKILDPQQAASSQLKFFCYFSNSTLASTLPPIDQLFAKVETCFVN